MNPTLRFPMSINLWMIYSLKLGPSFSSLKELSLETICGWI